MGVGAYFQNCTACLRPSTNDPASSPVVPGESGCDITRQACWEKSPEFAFGTKLPPLTRIERTGLGTRLVVIYDINPGWFLFTTDHASQSKISSHVNTFHCETCFICDQT